MAWMFHGCKKFNQPLGDWSMRNVISLANIFNGCRKFNQTLDKWDVKKVGYFEGAFAGCDALKDSPLAAWEQKRNRACKTKFLFNYDDVL
jgi:hypothetical protein